MRCSATDGAYDTFPDTGNYSFFTSSTDKTFNVSTYGNSSLCLNFYTIHGNTSNKRRFNNFRINTHLHGLQHITTCQVNSCSTFKAKFNIGTLSCNQSIYHTVYVTTC